MILKDKKESKIKIASKKMMGALASVFVALSFVGCGHKKTQTFVPTHPLVTQEQYMEELENTFETPEDIYISEDFARMPCPASQDAIKVNVNFDATDLQKEALEHVMDEYNEVFAFINPNYKFELNFSPTKKDLDNVYGIDYVVKKHEEIIDKTGNKLAGGLNQGQFGDKSETIPGKEFYNTTISLPEEIIAESITRFFLMAKHEFAHSFGLADTYNGQHNGQYSIMLAANEENPSCLTKNDIKILYSLYREPNKPYDAQALNEFIESHEGKFNFNEFFMDAVGNYIDNNVDSIKEKVKSNKILETTKNEVLQKIGDATSHDTSFGENQPVKLVYVANYDKPVYEYATILDNKISRKIFTYILSNSANSMTYDAVPVKVKNGIVSYQQSEEHNPIMLAKLGNAIFELSLPMNILECKNVEDLFNSFDVKKETQQTYREYLNEVDAAVKNHSKSKDIER